MGPPGDWRVCMAENVARSPGPPNGLFTEKGHTMGEETDFLTPAQVMGRIQE